MAGRKIDTKPWNQNLETIQPNEIIYVDYKDEQKSTVTNVKFKTTIERLPHWIEAHRAFYETCEFKKKDSCTTIFPHLLSFI